MSSRTLLLCVAMVVLESCLALDHTTAVAIKRAEEVLSRRKRFLIFPTGASISVAVCMTIGVYGNPQYSIFSWAVNYGFAYNLPTNSSYFINPPNDVLSYPFFEEDPVEPPTTTTAAPETLPPEHYHDHEPTPEELQKDPSTRRQYYVYYQPKYETKPMIQRRFRRDIYKNIEAVFDT